MITDYDSLTDHVIERPGVNRKGSPTPAMLVWELERVLYDMRFDAYWLVRRTTTHYVFSGPLGISEELLNMLPAMTAIERANAKRHTPQDVDGVGVYVMEFNTNEEDDGA